MRYELDANGYIKTVAFGCITEECNEYTGTVPTGYSSLLEWSENACINAYYIDSSGNLALDSTRLTTIKAKEVQDAIDNTPILRKDLYGSEETLDSQYIKGAAKGLIVSLVNIQTVAPTVKVTNLSPADKLVIYTQGRNMLPFNGVPQTISGINFSPQTSGQLVVGGTASADIEYTLAGSETNTEPLFVLKANVPYYFNTSGITYEFRYFDGETTSQVYTGSSTGITLSKSAKVTQVILKISSGHSGTRTFYPQLLLGNTNYNYTEHKRKTLEIDISKYTTIDYVLIDKGVIYVSSNGVVEYAGIGNLGLYSDCNTIYALEDCLLYIEYCTNVYDVSNLKFLQGKATTSNGFQITEDGGIIATDGNIGGWNITSENLEYETTVEEGYDVTVRLKPPVNSYDSVFEVADYGNAARIKADGGGEFYYVKAGNVNCTNVTASGDMAVTGGAWFKNRVLINRSGDANGLAEGTPELIIGNQYGSHLAFDCNEIIAKSNDTTPTRLSIQNDGGGVSIGSSANPSNTLIYGGLDLSATSPYIDFHYGNSTDDYTARIRETVKSNLYIYAGHNTYSTRFWFSERPVLSPNVSGSNATQLGTSSYPFYALFYQSIVQVSDRRLKENIKEIDDRYLELWNLLEPKTFNLISKPNSIQIGFIAQEVEEAMEKVGLTPEECGFLHKEYVDDENYTGYSYNLSYIDLGVLTHAKVKTLETRIEELEKKIAELTNS